MAGIATMPAPVVETYPTTSTRTSTLTVENTHTAPLITRTIDIAALTRLGCTFSVDELGVTPSH